MVGTGRVTRGQVEHEVRQQLARTLERTGPLTARGLARETKQTTGSVRHHLEILSRAGVIAPSGERQVAGEEIAYALTLERVPQSTQNALLGELSPGTALRLMEILTQEGTLTEAELAAQANLSRGELERYMRALRAAGWVKPARPGEIEDDADRSRDCPEWLMHWMRLTAEGDDEEDEERKSP